MIKKCLFPAAGYGTRFLPATKAMPKEMLPILAKPLIQYGVEEAFEAGITDMCFVTGRGKRALEDHFDISFELESQIRGTNKEGLLTGITNLIDKCTFSYTRQKKMLGLGHAILCGYPLIGNEPFAVLLADDLCDNSPGVLSQMKSLYEEHNCSIIAVMEIDAKDSDKYGIISAKDLGGGLYEVSDMVEKPSSQEAPSNLAVIGRYILTPFIFEILQHTRPGKNGEIQLTDAIKTQAVNSRVLAYKFKGTRYDCGSVDGYVKATVDFYEKSRRS